MRRQSTRRTESLCSKPRCHARCQIEVIPSCTQILTRADSTCGRGLPGGSFHTKTSVDFFRASPHHVGTAFLSPTTEIVEIWLGAPKRPHGSDWHVLTRQIQQYLLRVQNSSNRPVIVATSARIDAGIALNHTQAPACGMTSISTVSKTMTRGTRSTHDQDETNVNVHDATTNPLTCLGAGNARQFVDGPFCVHQNSLASEDRTNQVVVFCWDLLGDW